MNEVEQARFDAKVWPEPTSGCHLWGAALSEDGYGFFNLRGRLVRAHRVAWESGNGPIPEGLHVLHRCDTRSCCNPEHLFVGTHADNMADRDAKGRQAPHDGESNGNAKLTATEVAEIRARYAAGGVSQRALAAEFGVATSHLNNIVNRVRWKNVP